MTRVRPFKVTCLDDPTQAQLDAIESAVRGWLEAADYDWMPATVTIAGVEVEVERLADPCDDFYDDEISWGMP